MDISSFSDLIMPVVFMVIGIFLLIRGGGWTVDGAVFVANKFGISPLIVGFTIIAFGTSLPELLISVFANLQGSGGIAIGNVLGSNIFNTFAVMGIPRLIGDLAIPASILDFSLPMMVAVTIIFSFMFFESKINRSEGLMLIVLYCLFIYMSFGT